VNFDLDDISKKVYNAYSRYKENKQLINIDELKLILQSVINNEQNKTSNTLENAIERFLTQKRMC